MFQEDSKNVLVWGNLKSLSALKESDVKVSIATLCCTDNYMMVLTLDGNLYCSGHDVDSLVSIFGFICMFIFC